MTHEEIRERVAAVKASAKPHADRLRDLAAIQQECGALGHDLHHIPNAGLGRHCSHCGHYEWPADSPPLYDADGNAVRPSTYL